MARDQQNDRNPFQPPPEALAPREGDKALDVGIIGAGIGGLTAAISLLHSGHNVEIFEKSRFTTEVGAAITSPPNFTRVLSFYGFDFVKARATVAGDIIYYQGESNCPSHIASVSDFEARYGALWWYFHRVDLHNQLQQMALGDAETQSNERRAHLRLCTEVKDVELDGTITLQDGTTIRKDLVVVADGIRSSFTSKVVGMHVQSEHHLSMLRFLIPSARLLENPDTKDIFNEGLSMLRVVYGQGKSMVLYGCRGGELQNVAVLFKPEECAGEHGEETRIVSDALISRVTDGFHPAFRKGCRGADGIGMWKVFRRSPLARYARGRVVVIGDAAHPMAPVRSQGASMAVEDAAALGVLFSHMPSAAEVEVRLDLFNTLRVKRVAGVQTISAMHRWNPSNLSKEEEGYFDGKVPGTTEDIDGFILDNNVIRDAWELLQRSNERMEPDVRATNRT